MAAKPGLSYKYRGKKRTNEGKSRASICLRKGMGRER